MKLLYRNYTVSIAIQLSGSTGILKTKRFIDSTLVRSNFSLFKITLDIANGSSKRTLVLKTKSNEYYIIHMKKCQLVLLNSNICKFLFYNLSKATHAIDTTLRIQIVQVGQK